MLSMLRDRYSLNKRHFFLGRSQTCSLRVVPVQYSLTAAVPAQCGLHKETLPVLSMTSPPFILTVHSLVELCPKA